MQTVKYVHTILLPSGERSEANDRVLFEILLCIYIHICDHPWEKGVWAKFSKMRFLLFGNHDTFIIQIFCIWVVIAILVIKYSMLKSLPVIVRINKKPKVACFHC